MPVYTAHLREIIKKGVDSSEDYEKPLKGFKIAVDAGNGGGGFLATDVLAELGADTSGRILLYWAAFPLPCSGHGLGQIALKHPQLADVITLIVLQHLGFAATPLIAPHVIYQAYPAIILLVVCRRQLGSGSI